MTSEIRIPTLLGLGILLAGMAAGVILLTSDQILKSQAAPSPAPKNIKVTNITDAQVSVSWQTDEATSGFIQAGTTTPLTLSFRDERDSNLPEKHTLHFVTLTGLTPKTTYYYKITSGSTVYPESSFYSFQTTSTQSSNSYPALIGQILDQNRQPVGEALITLLTPGAQELSTITKIAGNFILPLSQIRNQTLGESFAFPATGSAKLLITDNSLSSQVTLPFPITGQPLPPFILGTNQDLTQVASSTATPSITPTKKPTARGDLNNDGQVNTLDRIILVQNYGKNPKIKAADLNNDKVVDQKDLAALTQIILQNSSKK